MSAIYKNGVQYVGITDAANMSVDVGQNTLNLKDTVQNVINNFADTETNPSSGDHSIGDFFTYNGILYKVIDDIEQGDTLIVGTNIVQTSFGKQLEEADSNSFIYAETVEQLYERINNIPIHQIRLFEINSELASTLTNGTITTFFKGYVANMDAEQHIFDFFGSDGNGYIYGQRIRFDSPTTFTVQRKETFPRIERTYIKRQQITTQLNSSENRLITQNFIMEDNITDYDIIQLIASKTGFFCLAKSRESGNYTRLWDTNLMPILGMGGTEIISNQDLNNFKTPGNYYCKGNSTVATLTNCPTTSAFKMFVSHPTGGSTSYVGQEIKVFDGNIRFYRWYGLSDDTWRDWQKLAPITGGASTVWTSNLTASRALISNTSGKIGVSSATTTELGYLSGVTSAIQTQLNGKAPTSHASTATTYGVASTANYGHVKYGTTSGTACQGNDSRLSNARTPVAHASTATTYGIGNGSNYGHIKLSDTYASTVGAAANGIAASQKALYDVYNFCVSNTRQAATTSLAITNAWCFGQLTGDSKSIQLCLPWYKRLPSTITISSISCSLRHVNGGYFGNSSTWNPKSDSSITVTVAGRGMNASGLGITISLPSTGTKKFYQGSTTTPVTNNTPVVGTISLTLSMSGTY